MYEGRENVRFGEIKMVSDLSTGPGQYDMDKASTVFKKDNNHGFSMGKLLNVNPSSFLVQREGSPTPGRYKNVEINKDGKYFLSTYKNITQSKFFPPSNK